jgi:hypothetical protein
MPTTTNAIAEVSSSSVAAEIGADTATRDAQKIAHRIAGIVANDERFRTAIQSTLDRLSEEREAAAASEVLAAVAAELTRGG